MIFRKKRKQIAEEFVQDAKESIQSSADESLELIFRAAKIILPVVPLAIMFLSQSGHASVQHIPQSNTATNVINIYISKGE